MHDVLSRAQIRGARAMLDWSMTDLSKAAHVSVSSVKRAEDEGQDGVSSDVVAVIRDALETEGIRFLKDDGSGEGLRLKATRHAAGRYLS